MNKDGYIRVLEAALRQYEDSNNWILIGYGLNKNNTFLPEKGWAPGAIARNALAVERRQNV